MASRVTPIIWKRFVISTTLRTCSWASSSSVHVKRLHLSSLINWLLISKLTSFLSSSITTPGLSLRVKARDLHPKWRAKVTTIEESKDLTSLSLNELIGNLKVHEMIIKKDYKIVKARGERKSLALKAKKESSYEECSTSGSENEEYAMAVRDFKKFFKRRGSDEDDEKVRGETFLVAQASNEICSNSSYFSDECSSMDDLALDNDNEKLKEEALKLNKFEKSTHRVNEMLSNQKPSREKLGLGFNSFEASSSVTKKIIFVKSQNTSSGGGPPNTIGGPLKDQTVPKVIMGSPICLGVDLEPDEWIKDSGFLKHMTGNQKLFSSYKAYNRGNLIFGSNLRGNIIGKGQICNNKCKVTFSEHDSEITKDGKIIGRGIKKKDLYVMKLGNKPKDKICLATIDENSTLWHRRLGYTNMRLLQSLASKELVRNLPKLKFDQHFCDACKIGKQAHASHKAKNIVSTSRCLELLHMDLFGPSVVRSYGGNLYTLVIVDDYSRYTWTRFLKDKTEAFEQFKIFSSKIQNQLRCSIVSIRTDHGREFDNEVHFGEFCNANGITHNFSAPRTPQSNGVVERKNRIL
ncbi:retrovirus-related pol polyprotein from transposon TNT 1-94 [Tanacetum coccineum]